MSLVQLRPEHVTQSFIAWDQEISTPGTTERIIPHKMKGNSQNIDCTILWCYNGYFASYEKWYNDCGR